MCLFEMWPQMSSKLGAATDDPDKASKLLHKNEFAFTESDLLVLEIDSATQSNTLMATLLET